jgi:hypothetical protein
MDFENFKTDEKRRFFTQGNVENTRIIVKCTKFWGGH